MQKGVYVPPILRIPALAVLPVWYLQWIKTKGTLMLSICITPHLNIPILSIPFVYDSTFYIFIKQQCLIYLRK